MNIEELRQEIKIALFPRNFEQERQISDNLIIVTYWEDSTTNMDNNSITKFDKFFRIKEKKTQWLVISIRQISGNGLSFYYPTQNDLENNYDNIISSFADDFEDNELF